MANIAIYGNTGLIRAICPICKDRETFVVDGLFTCCGEPYTQGIPEKKKLECEAHRIRRSPYLSDKSRIIQAQQNRCIYCRHTFGSLYVEGSKIKPLVLHWDHFIPWTYTYDNSGKNFVAACNICNLFKHDKIFDSLKEAREYVVKRIGKRDIRYVEDMPAVQQEISSHQKK